MGSRCCKQQLLFTILISFLLCFVLLCLNYSVLTDSNNGENKESISSYENNIIPLNTNPSDSISSLPPSPSESDSCLGRYIYIHELPSRFNEDLLKNCHLLTRGTEKNMCPYLVNFGFGPGIEFYEMGLFRTSQFSLEVIFHNKMRSYRCLTNDSSVASAIYVPFYAGLDVSQYLWGFNTSMRDSSGIGLVDWLARKPEWKKMWGRDHFLIAGRISWDFRRETDNESDWGSNFRFLPESKNMSMLSIESSSWNSDIAIPYPTSFHPGNDSEVFQWQDKMRSRSRQYLFSFAGAPRPCIKDSIRGKIIDQCLASGSLCKLLDCNYGATNCDNPINVLKVFTDSVFCLQPPGDSLTRRSIFDGILAGCIPVFFHPGTAYAQYIWHLPKDYTTYSLYIPERDVKDGEVNINETLLEVSKGKVLELREEVIRLIPGVVYSDPRSKLETLEDAFDVSVTGILKRIDGVRRSGEGRDPSIGFANKDEYRFTFGPNPIN